MASVPGCSTADLNVTIQTVSKKRATYQIAVTITGASVLAIDNAFNANNYSASLATMTGQVANVPGVSTVQLITLVGVPPSVASPRAPPVAQPVSPPTAKAPVGAPVAAPRAASASYLISSMAVVVVAALGALML